MRNIYYTPAFIYSICVTNDYGYVTTFRLPFPHSWLFTGFVTRATRRGTLVKQELPTLPGHLSSFPIVSGVCFARSVVFCVVFCISLFVLFSFFFWPLCCLSFFDLQICITPLESSISSWYIKNYIKVYTHVFAKFKSSFLS
jgi:hypothetical protein